MLCFLVILNIIISNMHITAKKGFDINNLETKFRAREEENKIAEALIYLKLRQFNCPSNQALIFSTKKNQAIDGTAQLDGPPNFRKLLPLKPQTEMIHGWIKGGEKLKYKNALCFQQFLRNKQSTMTKSINNYNKKQRERLEQLRRTKSQSLLNLNLKNSRQSLERISSMRQQIMKQRQNRNVNLKFRDIDLQQNTKSYFKEVEQLNQEGLVVKAGAFNHLIYDSEIEFVNTDTKGNILNNSEMQAFKKRENIHHFQKRMDSIYQTLQNSPNDRAIESSPIRFRSTTSFGKSKEERRKYEKQQIKQFERKIQKLIRDEYLKKNSHNKQRLKLTSKGFQNKDIQQ